MKDNTGIGSENVEALVDLKIVDKNINLVQLKKIGLDKIINKLILLSKSGNNLATALYKKIYENLNNFFDTISMNITYLNNYLFYKELTSIFDYTLSLDNINGNIKKHLSILNKIIYYFIKDSHKIIYKIFNNRKELGIN